MGETMRRRAARRAAAGLAESTPRLLLAAKAAVAAVVAWLLAPWVPFAESEYSYYAPMGVLVSMYPTVAASARAGLQSLAGLGIGLALGLAGLGIVLAGAPGAVALAVVIGIGILLGGIDALGAGRDWVALAALFVLLIGGPSADEFSLSYLLTMGFGVVVGVATNLLIAPPLYLRRASDQLTALKNAVCAALRDAADALDADSPSTPDASRDALAAKLSAVSEQVRIAEESSRGNPRSRRHRAERRMNARRLDALKSSTHATVELIDLLTRAGDEGAIPAEMRRTLAEAVRASADIVESHPSDERYEARLDDAAAELDGAAAQLDQHAPDGPPPVRSRGYAYASLVQVRRIVEASRRFSRDPAN